MKKRILLLSSAVLAMGTLLFTGCSKEDTTAPVITLIGDADIDHILNSAYTDQGATAEDDEDGDLTASITANVSIVNENQTGNYTITYEVSDAAGNVGTATRDVRVYNEAENLAGNYSGTDISPFPGGTTTNYSEVVSVSSTVNKRILVTKFGNYVNGSVYMDVNFTTNSITIPTQVVTCGSPAANRTFENAAATSTVGTGTPTVLTINYKETVGSTQVTAQGTLTKQ